MSVGYIINQINLFLHSQKEGDYSEWEVLMESWDRGDCSDVGLIKVFLQYMKDSAKDSYIREYTDEGIQDLVAHFKEEQV